MKVEQLFAKGKYMVIYLFPHTAVYDELGLFLWYKGGEMMIINVLNYFLTKHLNIPGTKLYSFMLSFKVIYVHSWGRFIRKILHSLNYIKIKVHIIKN